jgi:methylmalonyl-CoA/ethylmalonyl-CoA epimerase
MESIGTKSFMQICIVVKDAEKTMQNFMDTFGIERGTKKPIPEPETFRTIYRGKQIRTKTWYYVFKMGEMTIELTEPDDVPSVWKEVLDEEGEGLCYLGVMVPDSAKAVKELEKAGNPCIHFGGNEKSNYNVVDCRKTLGFFMNVKMQKS